MENTLNAICDWSVPENIAIEYHNSKTIERVNYSDLKNTIEKIQSALCFVNKYEFIGINNDVKSHCVPALILGIHARECAFVNLPSTKNREIYSKLGIRFSFSVGTMPYADLISELNIHGETVKLLEHRGSVVSVKTMPNKQNFAYAITTSGSTGEPKIVRVPHACIVPNIVDLKEILDLSSADKIAQITTMTFDPSIVEIFLSLSSGGTLFFVSNDILSNSHELLRLIFEHKVTVLQTTPSLWRYRWSDREIQSTIFCKESCLKALLFGGEPFPKIETLRSVKDRENKTKIYNVYGITEVSSWASIKEINLMNIDELDTAICQNLGKTLSQTIFQVRNQNGDIIRNGEGVLYIGSSSRICSIDSEESARSEIPVFRKTGDLVTINGDNIFYKSRCDRTIKRFGNRLDLAELETAVLKLKFVKNCIALWDEKIHKLYLCVSAIHQNESGNKFINDLRAQEELKTQLRKLPSHYQPDRIKYLNKFQLNTSGKICVKNLLRMFQNAEENSGCISDSEKAREILPKIWKNHLSLTTRSGFLDNGGTSVTAIQISNELSESLKKEFPELIGLLLRNETLANCIEYVTRTAQDSLKDNEIEDSTLSKNDLRIGNNKRIKYDFVYPEKFAEPNTCVWQKCRGTANGKFLKTENFRGSSNPKLSIEYTLDLKKCVDASPTIFRYSSGEIYTSVGSHAGVILTKQLNHHDSKTYEINLPDRIEASVLALNDFNGIVGCYDGHVYRVNLKTGKIIWKFKTGDVVKCTAVLSDDENSIFVGSYDKYLYRISVKDGTEIWKLKESEGSISATPRTCLKSHSVVFGTLDGTCMSLNQSSGHIMWKNKFQDPIFSAPGILENGDIIFCSVSGEVSCFDSETGRKTWRYKIDGNVFSHLVIRRNSSENTEDLIIGCNNKSVYCLVIQSNYSAPILRYSISLEYPIFATPYCEGDILIVADTNGNINLLNATNGEIVNSLKLNGDVFSSPVISEEFIVVGCRDNNVYVVKIDV